MKSKVTGLKGKKKVLHAKGQRNKKDARTRREKLKGAIQGNTFKTKNRKILSIEKEELVRTPKDLKVNQKGLEECLMARKQEKEIYLGE